MFTLKTLRRRFISSCTVATLLGSYLGSFPVTLQAGSPFRVVAAPTNYESDDIELRLAQNRDEASSQLPPPLPVPPPTAQPLPAPPRTAPPSMMPRSPVPPLPADPSRNLPNESSPSDRSPTTPPNPSVPSKSPALSGTNLKPSAPGYSQTSIADLNIDIRPKATTKNQEIPEDLAQRQMQQMPVLTYGMADEMPASITRHTADRFAYEPLYFEEANLERYGNHRGELQPVASAVRFYATIPALPYLATLHTPRKAYYWDWPYQTGRDAPRVRELPPLKLKPATVEAGAIAALILLFP